MTSSSTAHIFVRAVDPTGNLAKVAVLYDDGPNNFRYQELSLVSGDMYAADVSGLAAPPEVFAEARDDAGNVGTSANKAANFTAFTDTGKPSIVVESPLAGGSYTLGQQQRARYFCSDPGGVQSCSGTVANGAQIDTSTVGSHTFTVNATDSSGNSTSTTVTYVVRFAFSGFRPPVGNPPALNIVNAGSTIPVKWALQDAAGNYYRSLNAITSISSTPIRCPNATTDPVGGDVAAGLAGLKYDTTSEQYVYNWPTLKSWAGTCRRLYVGFADATTPFADFQFK